MRQKHRFLAAAATAALLAFVGPAGAGVMAVSILEVNDFMITDVGTGTQLVLGTQVLPLSGGNTADVSASLNGVTSSAASPVTPIVPPGFGAIDLLQRCVGACPPFPENSYAGIGRTPPPSAIYAVSDMVLSGTAIDISPSGFPNAGGADAKTRADVAITGGMNDGTSTTNTGTTTSVQFVAATDLTAQFSLDYIVQLLAYLDTTTIYTSGVAQATSSWSLALVKTRDGATPVNISVLNWVPTELNQNVGASEGPGTLDNFSIDTSGSLASNPFLLEAGDRYQLTIRHQSLADATFSVPEPAMMMLLGASLLGLGVIRRRR